MKHLSLLLIFMFWTSVIYPQNDPCLAFEGELMKRLLMALPSSRWSATCCPENEPEFVTPANTISDQSNCAGCRFSA